MAQEVALHKRQQITRSGKMMFAWVAAASVVVGFVLVISWFLVQQIIFRDKVIRAKNETVANLQHNNKVIGDLRDKILVLNTNTALQGLKSKPEENALQVVLDALPAEENILALGSSLQDKLVGGQPNTKLENLSLTGVYTENGASVSVGTNQGPAKPVPFRIIVSSADANALRDLLKRFESSIRIIDVDTLKIEKTDTKVSMIMTGHAFYLPEKQVTLVNKVIKPTDDGKAKK